MKFSDFKIKTPEQLLTFLSDNFHWGFLDNSGTPYQGKEPDFRDKLTNEYRMSPPDELLFKRYGLCYDMVTFEKQFFDEKEIESKTFFINYVRNNRRGPGHTFLVYKIKKKWYWFEFVWEASPSEHHRGIHEYDSLESLLRDVNEKYKQTRKGSADEYDGIYIIEYDATYKPYSYIEFVKNCYNGKKIGIDGVTKDEPGAK